MHKTKRSIVVLAAVLAGMLLPLSVFSEEGLKIRTIRVGVPVRPTAQITQRFIYIAEKGQVFDVIEKLDDWYLVQLPYGEKG